MRSNIRANAVKYGKNALIYVLIALAVYQTGQLWVENLSNRYFFYSFITSSVNPVSGRQENGGIAPYRIITGFGNKNLYHIASGSTADVQKADGDGAILALLKEGEYVGAGTTPDGGAAVLLGGGAAPMDGIEADSVDSDLLKNRFYAYSYGFPMPSDVFAKSYGQRSSLLTSRFEVFDVLFIIPPRGSDNRIRFLFVDESGGRSYEYACPAGAASESMVRNIQSIQAEAGELFYVSSKQSGFRMFDRNTYIPQWTRDSFDYYAADVANPYVDGEKLIANIGRKLDVYFDNPAARQQGMGSDGVFTYRDETTVVKYHPAYDVLDYASYKTPDKRTGMDFLASYYSALDFIEMSGTVVNDFYLAGYAMSGSRITFYFDYTLGNLPIVIPDSMKNETGLAHHIEVTVEYQRVIRYKKLVYNYYLDESMPETAGLDFYGSLNSMFASDVTDGAKLGDACLGYKVDRNNRLLLYWFLEIEGVSYIKSAD